jgi:putative FmdB family regulatory protein
MPTYDYMCKKCGKKFNLVMSIGEHDKRRVRCPKCSSQQVGHLVEPFFAVTSKKS